ncbi:DNA-binding MarR family transcriptional regulator [Actinoplanes tereljensis]|uniref:MarR family transcriptional regulator n=1 Tax=Paractinoplanes tereljensis TaxID=571912 RepID=A0A919TWM2_9ACTN|nr:MarR family transcriptional regulator [Actinoplanes tereljensis]GIF26148.1 MarR family transcriptional regulator [Actinoplanes tereljensis]
MTRVRKESELPDRLVRLVQGLSRTLVQATRRAGHLPALPESQVAVLRRLSHSGGQTPAQLADDLHLARPTISNLVRDLTADGLVERRPSPADGRSVLLVPTARAEEMLNAFRQGRSEAMTRAVAQLPAEDRARIEAALPSLTLLLDRIRAQT